MITSTLSFSDYDSLQEAFSEHRLEGHIVEVPFHGTDGTFLLNLTNKPQIADATVKEFTNSLVNHALPALRAELLEMAMKQIRQGTGASFIFSDQKDDSRASNLLSSYTQRAVTSGGGRKSALTYVRGLEEDEQEVAMALLIQQVTSLPFWPNQLSNTAFQKLSFRALPALLLANWDNYASMPLTQFHKSLNLIASTCDEHVKKRQADSPQLQHTKCDFMTFTPAHMAKSERKISSANRNFALSLMALGSQLKLWLNSPPKKHTRIQGTPFLCEGISEGLRATVASTASMNTARKYWIRFSLISSGIDCAKLPVGIGILTKAAFFDEHSPNGKMYLTKLVEYINSNNLGSYPVAMATHVTHNQSTRWYEKLRIFVNSQGKLTLASSNSTRNAGEMATPLYPAWFDFFQIYHRGAVASDDHKKAQAVKFGKWAIGVLGVNSPWDVKPTDLLNHVFSTEGGTYHEHLDSSMAAKGSKVSTWSTNRKMYSIVCNHEALMGKERTNPFDSLPEVRFTGARRRGNKTPRSRINQAIIDKMLDILLAEDENDLPTYTWAKSISLEAFASKGNARSDHFNVDSEDDPVFCPSRAAALAVLLVLPIRGVQARWLDEGYSDDDMFDPETLTFENNTSPWTEFENEYGTLNSELGDGNKGVIQTSQSLIEMDDFFDIYINTNKTKLWDPREQNGYYIPWPYTKGAKTPEERKLNRPYTVLFEQLKWLKTFSPNPTPVRFDHVVADRGRLTDISDVMADAPFVFPVFRDLTTTVSYQFKGRWENAAPPISKKKLETLFNELCKETEKQLKAEGFDVTLTKLDKSGNVVSIHDIHSLRVAGISHLLELGVPIHIVAEFVAGHMTTAMTQRYYKGVSSTLKEKLIAANQESPSAAEKAFDCIGNVEIIQPLAAPEDKILSPNVASLAPVEGGLCPLGGKGCEGCRTGMLIERTSNGDEEIPAEYGPVQAGCGNCRFWMTGPDFLGEQSLEMNRLMIQMREAAKEVKQLNQAREDLEWDLDDVTDVVKKRTIANQIMSLKSRVDGKEKELLPFMAAWSNRYVAVQESIRILEDDEAMSLDKPTLIGSDLRATLESATEFELVRTTIEQARLLPRRVVPIPEQPAVMLREFMDRILAHTGCAGLLARIPNKIQATDAASRLANQLVEHVEAPHLDALIEGQIDALPTGLLDFIEASAKEAYPELQLESNSSVKHRKHTQLTHSQE